MNLVKSETGESKFQQNKASSYFDNLSMRGLKVNRNLLGERDRGKGNMFPVSSIAFPFCLVTH